MTFVQKPGNIHHLAKARPNIIPTGTPPQHQPGGLQRAEKVNPIRFASGFTPAPPPTINLTQYAQTKDSLQKRIEMEVERFLAGIPSYPYNPRYYRRGSDYDALNNILYRWSRQKQLSPGEQQERQLALFLIKNQDATFKRYWWKTENLPQVLSTPQKLLTLRYLDGGTIKICWQTLDTITQNNRLNQAVIDSFNQIAESNLTSDITGVRLSKPKPPYNPAFQIKDVKKTQRQLFRRLFPELRNQALETIVTEGQTKTRRLKHHVVEYVNDTNANLTAAVEQGEPPQKLVQQLIRHTETLRTLLNSILDEQETGYESLRRKLHIVPTDIQGQDWFKALHKVLETTDPVEEPDLFKYGSFIYENQHATFVWPDKSRSIFQAAPDPGRHMLLRYVDTYDEKHKGNVSIWDAGLKMIPQFNQLDTGIVEAFNRQYQANLKIPEWFSR